MRPGFTAAVGGVVLSLLLAPSALPQGSKTSSPVELARRADQLKPGQWVWAPQIAPNGPIMVYVDLSRQIATVYRNGVRIGATTVSTGKAGHETPTGVFTILQKDADHRSSKYNNAAMPYMQRLTWDGVALHAGGLPGYPESHGCVHMPMAFSKLLFSATNLGVTVVVAGKAGDPMATRHVGLMAPTPPGAPASVTAASPAVDTAAGFTWNPQASPSGPVTIVMSKTDQLIVVLRNGVEIGRSKAVLPTDTETHVLTLTSPRGANQDWVYVGVPGHDGESNKVLDAATVDQVTIPPLFEANVRAILKPGATILVTSSHISAESTGEKLTVIDTEPKPKGAK